MGSAKKENLKVWCHEIVCQQRPLVFSLGLNNTPSISFKLVKSRIKNIRCFKQEASRCKMAGAGFHSIAKLRAPMPRFATIRITAWQSALNCTADCQPLLSGLIRILREVQASGIMLSNSDSWLYNPQYGHFHCGNPRSTCHGLLTQG
jgi:hypothetical protein